MLNIFVSPNSCISNVHLLRRTLVRSELYSISISSKTNSAPKFISINAMFPPEKL